MIALITFQSNNDLSDYKVFCVQGHKESKELKSYHVHCANRNKPELIPCTSINT